VIRGAGADDVLAGGPGKRRFVGGTSENRVQ
jgi:hypothetical protein